MEEDLNKMMLLDKIRAEYSAFAAFLAFLSEAQMTRAGADGAWSVKDVLAHLTAWQQRLLDILHAAQQGREPAAPVRALTDEEIDRLNAQFYAAARLRPLNDVQAAFHATYQQIIAAILALANEDVMAPRRFAWLGDTPLWQIISGNTYEHYQEHCRTIRAWLNSQQSVA
jgi:hypothetical protein